MARLHIAFVLFTSLSLFAALTSAAVLPVHHLSRRSASATSNSPLFRPASPEVGPRFALDRLRALHRRRNGTPLQPRSSNVVNNPKAKRALVNPKAKRAALPEPATLDSSIITPSRPRRRSFLGLVSSILAKRQFTIPRIGTLWIVPNPKSPNFAVISSLYQTSTTARSTTTSRTSITTSSVPMTTTTARATSTTRATTTPRETSTTGAATTTTTTTTSGSTTTTSSFSSTSSTTDEPQTTTTATTTTTSKTASQTGSSGLGDGAVFWNLKSKFSSLASFVGSTQITSWAWGQENVDVVQGVPASAWADGATESNNGSAVSVAFPAGSYSPSHTPIGGVGFYEDALDVSAATNLSFAYSVFFPADFQFVKGGKLPGLYGGKKACSGGSTAENCFSTRLMWRAGGLGELYLYAPREKQVNELCTLGPLSFCNSVYGMSIGRGSWTFLRGAWNNIRQDVWLNTPGVADGGFNIWVNGKLVLHSDTVYYRNSALGGLANGTTVDPIPLIDYDSLPDSVVIPNGGLKATPTATISSTSAEETFSPTLVTKIVGTGTATSQVVETSSVIVYASDWEVRKKKRAVVTLVPPAAPTAHFATSRGYEIEKNSSSGNNTIVDKRATLPLPIGHLGMKFDTFYGGSTAAWAPTVDQAIYLNQFGLRIRS